MTQKIKAEGDYEAARRYREDVEDHARSGDVEGEARDAEKAVDGEEGKKLREAEEIGKSKSRGEDPQLNKRQSR